MVSLGITLCLLAAVFAAGARLMLTSLTPARHVGTYCVRCGQELESATSAMCPKCRRMLTDEMRVTCSRGEINRERLTLGGLIVAAALVAAPLTLRWLAAGASDEPAATRPAASLPAVPGRD